MVCNSDGWRYRLTSQITDYTFLWFSSQTVDDASLADLKSRVSPHSTRLTVMDVRRSARARPGPACDPAAPRSRSSPTSATTGCWKPSGRATSPRSSWPDTSWRAERWVCHHLHTSSSSQKPSAPSGGGLTAGWRPGVTGSDAGSAALAVLLSVWSDGPLWTIQPSTSADQIGGSQ